MLSTCVEARRAGADALLEDQHEQAVGGAHADSRFMMIAFTGMTIERKTTSRSTKLSERTTSSTIGSQVSKKSR